MHAFAEPLTVEQVRDPDVPGDGVVIEVRATGLCRSDWHVWMGHDPSIRLPHVPGHELAGVVATAQSAARRPGDGPVLLRQRRCEPCRQGHTQVCDVAYSPASAHRAHSPSWWRSPLPTSTAPAFQRRRLRRGGGAGLPLHDRLRGGGGARTSQTRRLAGGAPLRGRGALSGDARQGARRGERGHRHRPARAGARTRSSGPRTPSTRAPTTRHAKSQS
jgi:alcohol dehydrogenase-like protein